MRVSYFNRCILKEFHFVSSKSSFSLVVKDLTLEKT